MPRYVLAVVTVAGFVIAVVGVAMLSVPAATIVCGASLAAFGLLVDVEQE